MKVSLLIAVALLIGAGRLGGSIEPGEYRTDEEGQASPPVSPVFEPFYRGPVYLFDREAEVRAALPYDSIELERSGGNRLPGGLFKLTLFRSGTATLWTDGGGHFGPEGQYAGQVRLSDLGKVSHLIAEANPVRFARRYEVANVTDLNSERVTIVTRERTLVIDDYGETGPLQLWAIHRAIEAIGTAIDWKPK